MRIYLTSRVAVEEGGVVRIDERQLPGGHGRLTFVYLTHEHRRPVPRDELAEALWPAELPPAWDSALSAVVSKLRSLFRRADLDVPITITSSAGCYRLELPPNGWVDLEAAPASLHEAEGLLLAGQPRAAWSHANVAATIAQRQLLPGADAPWIDRLRARLVDTRVRALDCLAESYLANGEEGLAVRSATDSVELEPYRESGYRRLMRIHLELGNRGEAVRVFQRCRRILGSDLGIEPSQETRALVD